MEMSNAIAADELSHASGPLSLDRQGTLLAADDVGNVIWRVTSRRCASKRLQRTGSV
jgi:hypothetical protein